MIAAGGFDILAHLELIKKNNARFSFFSPGDGWYKQLLKKTASHIAGAKKNLVVEVNTGSIIRGYSLDPYPSLDMLKLLKERNIPLTQNADAHAPDHLGGGYETAQQSMQQAGYTTMALFQGREDGKAVWREESL
jgi:histidinol-phosphatase (PHP family)